jgi:hypothetical protein
VRPNVADYLKALSRACAEAAHNPAVLRVLLGVLKIAPRTILQLIGD